MLCDVPPPESVFTLSGRTMPSVAGNWSCSFKFSLTNAPN